MIYRHFRTREAIDAQYDTSRQMPADDLDAVMRSRRPMSEEARRTLPHHLDIRYGSAPEQMLDVFPANRPDAPAVIFIHGGYWSTPEIVKDIYSWVALGFQEQGYATFVIDYGVCPDYRIGQLLTQCEEAIAWVYANAHRFGASRDKIYVSGHSAGGHLSAMLTLTNWPDRYTLPADVIKGICPISGLFDLEPFPHTWLQQKLCLTPEEVKDNSPTVQLRVPAAPMLIIWGAGESEEFHRQSEKLHARCVALGISSHLLPIEGTYHSTVINGLADPRSEISKAIAEHVEETCRSAPS